MLVEPHLDELRVVVIEEREEKSDQTISPAQLDRPKKVTRYGTPESRPKRTCTVGLCFRRGQLFKGG